MVTENFQRWWANTFFRATDKLSDLLWGFEEIVDANFGAGSTKWLSFIEGISNIQIVYRVVKVHEREII